MSRHGATYLGDERTRFSVWAPTARRVELVLDAGNEFLEPRGDGFHEIVATGIGPGTNYRYLLDEKGPFADPASRFQPFGVDGPSQVIELTSAPMTPPLWRGLPQHAQVICELHVGTFSALGTFAGVISGLDELAYAGYTAIELMPIAEFPGARNWGYDGVFPFAVQSSYGGPKELQALVEAAHRRGIAVLVDVVYNHLGPEGSVHGQFGPYFTDRYRTPWGMAINFDGKDSDAVRSYFIEHACYLVDMLGIDGLRLDAVHAIADQTARPFVAELVAAVHAEGRRLGRTVTVSAESSDNDPRLVAPAELGGFACDGWWDDDFHHALRVALTDERDRYFADYDGLEDLALSYRRGYVIEGGVSRVHGRRHGAPPIGPLRGERFIAYAQNHDQIGNGGFGTRLAARLALEAQFPITAALLCSPFVPLRFMGEEYGETAPFNFFTSFSGPQLIEAVRTGRRDEVGAADGSASLDPQDPATFEQCRPNRRLVTEKVHADLLLWQRELLQLRRDQAALGTFEPELIETWVEGATLVAVRRADLYLDADRIALIVRLAPSGAEIQPPLLAGQRLGVLAVRNCGRCAVGDQLEGTIVLGPWAALVVRLGES